MLTNAQRSKLIQLVGDYADKRQEWLDTEFPVDSNSNIGLALMNAFDDIVEYIDQIIDKERKEARE